MAASSNSHHNNHARRGPAPQPVPKPDPARLSNLYYLQLYAAGSRKPDEVVAVQRNPVQQLPPPINGMRQQPPPRPRPEMASRTGTYSVQRTLRTLARGDVMTQLLSPQPSPASSGGISQGSARTMLNHSELERDIGESLRPESCEAPISAAGRQSRRVIGVSPPQSNPAAAQSSNASPAPRPTITTASADPNRMSKRIEPVLNTRMKNMSSNFSTRCSPLEREHFPPPRRSACCRGSGCSARRALRNATVMTVTTLAMGVALFLLFSQPAAYLSYYENVLLPDRTPEEKPRVAICLQAPFMERRVREFGSSLQLASFLLLATSPFLPNAGILDDKALLADLTAQLHSLLSRVSPVQSLSRGAIRRTVRALAPRCVDVIASCKSTASPKDLTSEECCRAIFNKMEITMRGVCFVADTLSEDTLLPSRLEMGPTFRLSVALNATTLDNLVIPDQRIAVVPSALVTASVFKRVEDLSFTRDDGDFSVYRDNAVVVGITKRALDRTAPGSSILGYCSGDGSSSARIGSSCRAAVVQMISEKAVNCSLVSLSPRQALPVCGPIESLALGYVLRKQGAMLRSDPDMRTTFERSLEEQCGSSGGDDAEATGCYSQSFEAAATYFPQKSHSEADPFDRRRTATLAPQPYARVEFSLASSGGLVQVRRFRSGLLELFPRVGALCGCCAAVALVLQCAAAACRRRAKRTAAWNVGGRV